MKSLKTRLQSGEMSGGSLEKKGNEELVSHSMVRMGEENDEFGIVRTLDPIPVGSDGYYFKVEINDPQNNQPYTAVHIGLTSKNLSCPTKTVENWVQQTFSGFKKTPHSFGYSSSGTIYGKNTEHNFSIQQSYSSGDTIGCHVDNVKGICCFSKNGVYLDNLIHLTHAEEPLFPTIAFASSETILKTSVLEKKFEFDMLGM
jgi:hypothetical protein